MKAVIQRVERAAVRVDDVVVGEIGTGLCVFVGVTHTDAPEQAEWLARKIFEIRLLRDERSISDNPAEAGVLVVSQFTLYGDARKGRRPTWSAAAPGEQAEPLVDALVAALRRRGARVATGIFGAHMSVRLTNDGPVTVIVEA